MIGLTHLVVAAAVFAGPMVFVIGSAQAATARQQALQGQGIYTTSKGVPERHTGPFDAQDEIDDIDLQDERPIVPPHRRQHQGY